MHLKREGKRQSKKYTHCEKYSIRYPTKSPLGFLFLFICLPKANERFRVAFLSAFCNPCAVEPYALRLPLVPPHPTRHPTCEDAPGPRWKRVARLVNDRTEGGAAFWGRPSKRIYLDVYGWAWAGLVGSPLESDPPVHLTRLLPSLRPPWSPLRPTHRRGPGGPRGAGGAAVLRRPLL